MNRSLSDDSAQRKDLVVGWSAFAGAVLAIAAWAACCVLPIALSVAGLSLAGTDIIAGQRGWLTVGAAVLASAGWWMVWRRRRLCAADERCPPPSRTLIGLLVGATVLIGLALIWQPIVEPVLLASLRTLRA